VAGIFAPVIAPSGMAEVVGDVWEPSSTAHLLRTDNIGRDLLTRMIYGGRTTIYIATAATLLSFVTGSVLGFLAAVLGGWADAARQLGDPDAGDIAHWLDARLDATVALTVGHRDILAMPQAERSG